MLILAGCAAYLLASDMQPKPTSPKLSDPSSLNDALRVDRSRLQRLQREAPEEKYREQVESSINARRMRQEISVRINYDADLPITQHRDLLIQEIRKNPVLVVCGETGSGKSTQLPKLCLEAGLGRDGMIGHTQPRRLAARSIANRIADEIGGSVGEIVGYKVRFGDQTSDQTLIKLMTDGILLAETQSDRNLNQYDAIIIDEAHERSLNIDFLLGYLKNLQQNRPELKIIITSATIDAERFAQHFAIDSVPAPIISVEGRGYPVEIQHLPWNDEDQVDSARYHLPTHVTRGLDLLADHGSGDTLVFLPTERDIREVSHHVAGHFKRLGIGTRYELLPLYARLPQSQQQRIFRPDGKKNRIIFATNVAESSLTVPGIRYVVDSGTARVSRYNPRRKVQRLPIEPISQASANQRAGRCGRLGPGICVRLFSEEDFDSREKYTTPEIQRANLASVILQLKSLKLGNLEDFPLLDRPKPTALNDGIRTLRELNAIDDKQVLTKLGVEISRLPVDPRVARILIEAEDNQCLAEILPIAAALEVQDPRERPIEHQKAADECHLQFKDPSSDFLSLLRLWKYYNEIRKTKSRNQADKTLRRQFLSPTRMREWSDVYRQLKDLMSERQQKPKRQRSRKLIGSIRYESDSDLIVSESLYEKIHLSLLTGLLSAIGMRGDKHEYTGSGGIQLALWPGSGVFELKPKWIVASELIETTRTYARVVAKVQPAWIESIAKHLLKSSYSDPHWSGKRGSAFCYESQYLFGLPIVAKRRVPLAPIDPQTARSLLIEEGLVENKLQTNAAFVRHNLSLLKGIADLAHRTRDRKLIIDSHQVANLYHSRLPSVIIDRSSLEKMDGKLDKPRWSQQGWNSDQIIDSLQCEETTENEESLYFHPSDLIIDEKRIKRTDFPNEIVINGSRLPLEYDYSPGTKGDGVRVKVHQSALAQMSPDLLDWMVPGLFVDKLIQLIKSLPKRLRRNFVPAADAAHKIANELSKQHGKKPFYSTICKAFSAYAETEITENDFQKDKLDDYLRFIITVVDDDGNNVAENRDLFDLQKSFRVEPTTKHAGSLIASADTWARNNVTSYDVESFPEFVMKKKGGMNIRLYPGWIDHRSSVSTELFTTLQQAEQSIRAATGRLFFIAEKKEIKSHIQYLPGSDEAKIKLSDVISAKDFDLRLMDLLTRIAFVDSEKPIRSKSEFNRRQADSLQRLSVAAQAMAQWLGKWVEQHFRLRSILEEKSGWLKSTGKHQAIENQLKWLYHEQFLEMTPWDWLIHYPRYLEAIRIKIDRLTEQSKKTTESETTIQDLWNRWLDSLHETERTPILQAHNELRWMIEELRVSLFAQSLGTSIKISPKRCEAKLNSNE